ncbi:hypothetical protein CLOSTASPAR_01104 [[Clostridium] asparagiforme DSM 15981]|uniref:Uncharacterized protein n=1 Tax=[Clostridium] asparagiforme DSM 15981 TaxID=518636 RepID=C0CVV0_9FIRM|nr:hypothetical protein CLOSTASPAR_01104 [[Clostridium] asparagiforme DSM 15981]
MLTAFLFTRYYFERTAGSFFVRNITLLYLFLNSIDLGVTP